MVKSKMLKSPHAFSDRSGGVSTERHTASLNLAFERGDEESVVMENLRIFAKEAGFESESIVSLPQIHSDTIIEVGPQDRGRGYYVREDLSGCDGYITNKTNVVLGIKTADCVPVLFEAEMDGQIIAIGAVHAGWKGTLAGIAPKCVEMICERYDVLPGNIRACIGPCIHACCYEVGSDVRDAFISMYGKEMTERFFAPVSGKKEKFMCDLPHINECLLLMHQMRPENIEILPICTCCNHDIFYSHRYTNGIRGTMLNVIYLQ